MCTEQACELSLRGIDDDKTRYDPSGIPGSFLMQGDDSWGPGCGMDRDGGVSPIHIPHPGDDARAEGAPAV